jgi:hypothetical protein
MKQTCDPPIVVDWAEASSLVVVLSAQEGIPGAKAELARREKEAQELDKSADIEKNNPNRDPKGRFTFGSGGPQGGGGGAGGAGEAEGGAGGSGGAGETGDISSELSTEYGTTSETKRAQELRIEHEAPDTKGDPVMEDIAKKQGFDGKAEIVDQKEFDKIVADGGTVTHRGIADYYDAPGADAKYIQGETAITNEFAEGSYYAGNGVYGSGIYTSTDVNTANYYATEDGRSGSVVTMAVRPTARIATPTEWNAARETARNGTGGFMGADNEGRILAAQGFDGYRVVSRNIDAPSNQFIVVINRKALVVLKK